MKRRSEHWCQSHRVGKRVDGLSLTAVLPVSEVKARVSVTALSPTRYRARIRRFTLRRPFYHPPHHFPQLVCNRNGRSNASLEDHSRWYAPTVLNASPLSMGCFIKLIMTKLRVIQMHSPFSTCPLSYATRFMPTHLIVSGLRSKH